MSRPNPRYGWTHVQQANAKPDIPIEIVRLNVFKDLLTQFINRNIAAPEKGKQTAAWMGRYNTGDGMR